ncbi:MAG: hypothetical protein A3D92_25210 [Bacteroidetes bacterium RIFCSPHIGHO2_02_FULL_44_7]|nr:MAG: hypothetical protein A3D92_25210 [Bacteroidetes bacterium RIFCSPHIGHO2_02_FULL_44_7]
MNFTIAPNPTSGLLKIQSSVPYNSLRVLEIGGHEIVKSTENSDLLNLTHLASGVYLIEIHTDQGPLRQRFVKN